MYREVGGGSEWVERKIYMWGGEYTELEITVRHRSFC